MSNVERAIALCDRGFASGDRNLYEEIDALLAEEEETETIVLARKLAEAGPTLSSPRFAYPHIKDRLSS